MKLQEWKLDDADRRVEEEGFLVGLARAATVAMLPRVEVGGPRIERATRVEETLETTQTIRAATYGNVHYEHVVEHSTDAAGPSSPGPSMSAQVEGLAPGFTVSVSASIRPAPFSDAGIRVRAVVGSPDGREDLAIAAIDRCLAARRAPGTR
jgi:hypothetical protein